MWLSSCLTYCYAIYSIWYMGSSHFHCCCSLFSANILSIFFQIDTATCFKCTSSLSNFYFVEGPFAGKVYNSDVTILTNLFISFYFSDVHVDITTGCWPAAFTYFVPFRLIFFVLRSRDYSWSLEPFFLESTIFYFWYF